MNITRFADATEYSPPKHRACHAMHLQHKSQGSDAPYWVGCSYFLPGGEAEWDASPLPKIYLVLDGEITVSVEDEQVTLRPMDSVSLSGGENRQVRNDTTGVVTMLVILPYPPANPESA